MSVTPPQIIKKPIPVFLGPSDKEIADLQVKKANLLNDIENLTKDFNDLAGKKDKLVKEVASEMELYNGMVLKTTAEMQQDLEDLKSNTLDAEKQKTYVEISGVMKKHQLAIDELQRIFNSISQKREIKLKELSEIEIKIQARATEHESLKVPLENLKKQITDFEILKIKAQDELHKIMDQGLLLKEQWSNDLKELQKQIDSFKGQIQEAEIQLQAVLADVVKAKKEEVEARDNTEKHRQGEQDFANFLKRKERDLQIWEKRLMPAFKEKYPNGEMKFI